MNFVYCQEHKTQKKDIFCIKCRCEICAFCQEEQHKNHLTESLTKFEQEMKNDFNLIEIKLGEEKSHLLKEEAMNDQLESDLILEMDRRKNYYYHLEIRLNQVIVEKLEQIREEEKGMTNQLLQTKNKLVAKEEQLDDIDNMVNNLRNEMSLLIKKRKFYDAILNKSLIEKIKSQTMAFEDIMSKVLQQKNILARTRNNDLKTRDEIETLLKKFINFLPKEIYKKSGSYMNVSTQIYESKEERGVFTGDKDEYLSNVNPIEHLHDIVKDVETKLGTFKSGIDPKVEREFRPFCKTSEGNFYEGQWNSETNEIDGYGILIGGDGSKYEGFLQKGKLNGKGRKTIPNGDSFEGIVNLMIFLGDWVEGHPHGYGVYIWADGNKYVGEYNLGNREGQGISYYPDGAKHIGQYKNDHRNGRGIFIWPDGDIYDGEFVNEEMTGEGFYYKYTSAVKAEFQDGKLIRIIQ